MISAENIGQSGGVQLKRKVKTRMDKRLMLCFLLQVIPIVCCSQSPVRLSECRRLAQENHTWHTQYHLIEVGASAQEQALKRIIRPNLRGVASATYFSDVPDPSEALAYSYDFLPLAHDFYNGALLFSQYLYDGGEYRSKKEELHVNSRLEKLKTEESAERIGQLVDELFMNVLLIRKGLEVLQVEDEQLRVRLQDAHSLFDAGKIFRKEVMEVETALLMLEARVGELQAEEKKCLAMLAPLTGRDYSPMDVFLLPLEESAGQGGKALVFSQIDLLMEKAEASRRLAKSMAMPRVQVYAAGGYGRPGLNYYNRSPDWFGFVGIMLQVPLTGWREYKYSRLYLIAETDRLRAWQTDLQKQQSLQEIEHDNEIRKYADLEEKATQIVNSYSEMRVEAKKLLDQGETSMSDYLAILRAETNARLSKESYAIERVKAQLKRQRITIKHPSP